VTEYISSNLIYNSYLILEIYFIKKVTPILMENKKNRYIPERDVNSWEIVVFIDNCPESWIECVGHNL